jgi:microcystin-dependent protein
MSNYEATKYDFSGANLTGIEGIPTATIVPWSSASVPTGFLECNGQAVSRSTYSALFAIVSTTYGTGDGSSTFNVPDLQDNVAMGKSGTKALASTGGANTVANTGNVGTNINVTGNVGGNTANATLSTAQMPSHSHIQKNSPGQGNPSSGAFLRQNYAGASNNNTNVSTHTDGSGTGHSHTMSATFTGSGNASSTFTGSSNSVLQPYLTIIYIIKT